MVAECREGAMVGRHSVVGEEAPHHASQPPSLFSDILVPAAPEVFADFQQLRHFPVTSRMAGQLEVAPSRSCTDVGQPQEVEGLRFAVSPPRSARRSLPAEFDQPGLVGM